MKFEILTFSDHDRHVAVKNHNDHKYSYTRSNIHVEIEPGKLAFLPTGHARMLFGNWDRDDFAEKRFRNNHGISHYVLTVSDGGKFHKKTEDKPEIAFDSRPKEEEFADLNSESEDSEEIVGKCSGFTKSGLPCKRLALPNSEFCASHAESGE